MGHPVNAETPAEKALRVAFSLGKPLDLNEGGSYHKHGCVVHDVQRLIREWVLRDLLLSTSPPPESQVSPSEGHVRQLTVFGADIEGPLDLQFAKIDCPIRLEDCWFDNSVTLSEAELRSVSLRNSTVGKAINASHVRVTGDLILEGVHVCGPLQLGGAHLEDDLHLTDAKISQPRSVLAPARGLVLQARTGNPGRTGDSDCQEPPLLDLEDIQVKGRILADRMEVKGKVSMNSASVGGTLQLQNAQLGHVPEVPGQVSAEVAWSGDGLKVEGELNAKELRANGRVSLVDAHVQSLVLHGIHIQSSSSKAALLMDRLHCSGSLFCDEEIQLTGGIKAIGITVGASLYLGKGVVQAPASSDGSQRAVCLQRARIGDDLSSDDGFMTFGLFDIADARIGGSVDLCGATLKPAQDQSLSFDAGRAQIGGNLTCDEDFRWHGTMALMNASLGGRLAIRETSGRHNALLASGLRVGRNADLRTGGTVNLAGADVTESLTINLSYLTSSKDQLAAADLSGLTARVLNLRGRPVGYLDLARASVRLLIDDPMRWYPDRRVPPWVPVWAVNHIPALKSRLDKHNKVRRESPVVLDGLVYEDIAAVTSSHDSAEVPVDSRLAWLEAGTMWTRLVDSPGAAGTGTRPRYHPSGFVPQPYQQLAAVYRRKGRDSDARDVLHAMYCRQNSLMHPLRDKENQRRHPALRVWNTAQNWALGYGYRPKRAFLWILVLAALTTAWILEFDNQAHIGVIAAAILSLGLALPGSGLDRIERIVEMTPIGHLFALGLVLTGLVLGATVIAAIGRAIKN